MTTVFLLGRPATTRPPLDSKANHRSADIRATADVQQV
jgi:hypothetical protein